MILKNYANLNQQQQTHYRRAGDGQPLVMLHASPMSSEYLAPLISELAKVADVIAPDTPGYGQSDSLSAEQMAVADDLTPYTDWLLSFLDFLELPKVGLYGTATGAQISIEFARLYPERVAYVILDNAAHFTDEEREDVMRNYFPSVAPQADGSHLQQVWEMANGVSQWFPWYAQDEQHRISQMPPPPQVVHGTAMAYLSAGEDYAQAYRRAFNNEKGDRIARITVPTRIFRWDSGPLREYTDRLANYDYPENVQMYRCSGPLDQRYAALTGLVQELSE